MKMCRQGDILLIRVYDEDVDQEHPQEDKVVAEGSITGHHHRIVNGEVYRQRRSSWDGRIGTVVAHEGCQLVHEEHDTIDLPIGIYKVIKQREVSGDVED